MTIPTELIVVGMRFCPQYAKLKPNMGDILYLKKESTNKVNPNAVAVYFIATGQKADDSTKIGYIRDKDLPYLEVKDFYGSGSYTSAYEITRVCQNYLRITLPNVAAEREKSSPFEDIFAKHHGHEFDVAYPQYLDGEWVTNGIPVNKCTLPFDVKVDEQTGNKYVISRPRREGKIAAALWKDKISSGYIDDKELVDTIKDLTKEVKREKTKMINTNSMRDSFFKEVKNVALDMQSGKLGVITKDGVVVAEGDGVAINPITEMAFTIPAFAMRVPIADLQAGDIIISSGDPVFYREGTKAGYLTVTTNGTFQEVGAVSNLFFGKNTVMAVKNMFGSDTGVNPMMMAMMFSDKDSSGSGGFDFKKMMMMQMMVGNKGGDMGSMNPLMFMMMADKM